MSRRPHEPIHIPPEVARVDLHALVAEMQALNAQRAPCAVFSVQPFEGYTLIAALQATSRHPGLSDAQREIVLGFARQIAEQLIAMARHVVGPDSVTERTIEMGWHPEYDVRRGPRQPT